MSSFLFKSIPVVIRTLRLGTTWGFAIKKHYCKGGEVYFTASGTRNDGTTNPKAFPTLVSAIVWTKGESNCEV